MGRLGSGASGLGAEAVGERRGGRGGALSLSPALAGAKADQELPEGRLHGEDRAQGTSDWPPGPRPQSAVGIGHLGPGGAGQLCGPVAFPGEATAGPLSSPSGPPWRGWPGPNHVLRAGVALSQDPPRGPPAPPHHVLCPARPSPGHGATLSPGPRWPRSPEPGAHGEGTVSLASAGWEAARLTAARPREGRCTP